MVFEITKGNTHGERFKYMINVAFIKSKMLRIPWKILGQGEMICVLNIFGVCKGKHIEPS